MYAPGADICSLSPAGWKSPPNPAFAWITARRRLPAPPLEMLRNRQTIFSLADTTFVGVASMPLPGYLTWAESRKDRVNPVTQPIGPMTAPDNEVPPLTRWWKDESGQD